LRPDAHLAAGRRSMRRAAARGALKSGAGRLERLWPAPCSIPVSTLRPRGLTSKPAKKLTVPAKSLTLRELSASELAKTQGGIPPPSLVRNVGDHHRA